MSSCGAFILNLAVFVQKVRTQPENLGKTLNEINWSAYPISIGMTLELCAGIMDKRGLSPRKTAQEEIVEECGYEVPEEQIQFVKSFM